MPLKKQPEKGKSGGGNSKSAGGKSGGDAKGEVMLFVCQLIKKNSKSNLFVTKLYNFEFRICKQREERWHSCQSPSHIV